MKQKKIALFIDCENIAARWVDEVIERLQNVGDLCIKKAYGDWRSDSLKSWNAVLIHHAIEPVHVITGNHNKKNQSGGKNSCDIKMSIDVMNCLYDGVADCIALASSDSDFASLAQEIRSKGLQAIGFGEIKSREEYRNSFTSFEILQKEEGKKEQDKITNNHHLINILKKAIDETSDNSGVSNVSVVGNWMRNNYSQTARSYGKKSWGDVFKELHNEFQITYDKSKNTMKVKYLYW
ncbi:NYN domain-containing protein [Helicobacter anatolicus]|uniref:NYN domain-containing protein n=1 Tax=Helicobacter anatolicus TaxID=2905874 RepID=UPI001E4387B4|nr:NYN domain-containing protein [Helicobacter anatolicus]MCE3040184.1 NYN domain-containing protein [Helicobacter anatolicus]